MTDWTNSACETGACIIVTMMRLENLPSRPLTSQVLTYPGVSSISVQSATELKGFVSAACGPLSWSSYLAINISVDNRFNQLTQQVYLYMTDERKLHGAMGGLFDSGCCNCGTVQKHQLVLGQFNRPLFFVFRKTTCQSPQTLPERMASWSAGPGQALWLAYDWQISKTTFLHNRQRRVTIIQSPKSSTKLPSCTNQSDNRLHF